MKLHSRQMAWLVPGVLALAFLAQPAETPQPDAPAPGRLMVTLEALQQQVAELKKAAYKPTLGELMTSVQMRHAKLWFAGQAGHWQLAAFEAHELDETLEDLARLYPTHRDAPQTLAVMLGERLRPSLDQIDRAIATKSGAQFTPAFDALTTACNGCHQATVHGFVVVKRPTASPFSNQDFTAPPSAK